MNENNIVNQIEQFLHKEEYNVLYPFIKNYLEVINKSHDNIKNLYDNILDFYIQLCNFDNKINNQYDIIEKLKSDIEILKQEIIEKDNRISKLEDDNKFLHSRIDTLEFENIFRDYMMTTAEGVILFETNIVKEVYAENYYYKMNYEYLLDQVYFNKLTPDQLDRFNKISNSYVKDFYDGIFGLNNLLRDLKQDRNNNSHDLFKSPDLSIEQLKEKMDNYILNTKNIKIKKEIDDYKFVVDLIIDDLKNKNGDYPFKTLKDNKENTGRRKKQD